jgi:hypothetical protein
MAGVDSSGDFHEESSVIRKPRKALNVNYELCHGIGARVQAAPVRSAQEVGAQQCKPFIYHRQEQTRHCTTIKQVKEWSKI